VAVALTLAAVMAACERNAPTGPSTPTSAPASVPPPGASATAPTISRQPEGQTIAAGQTATLTVATDGTAPLAYQWFSGASGATSSPVNGATSATFTTPALAETTTYWVRVSNTAGAADSSAAEIKVTPAPAAPPPPTPPAAAVAPSITAQPQSQTLSAGQAATLSVAADGTAPLTFQWYSGTSGSTASPIGGATSSSFTTPSLTASTSYWVRVTNGAGTVDSMTATITISAPPPSATAPAVTSQPLSQTISSGQSVTMTVGASGTAPLSYQWYIGASGATAVPVTGATSASYATPALTTTTLYWVRVSNAAGTTDSSTATITVSAPAGIAPAITAQPQGQTITAGQAAALSVAANGTGPLSYQWYIGASGATAAPVTGATTASYATPALTTTTSYWVRVSNAFGAADSVAATITILTVTSNPTFEDQVLVLVNQRRAAGATCGGAPYAPVAPLTMNGTLRTAARLHSQDMAAQNYFSHTSLDGRTFSQRLTNAGYAGAFPWGENIAAGQPTPEAVMDAWMASTGHCTNIMNGSYRAIGVGYAFRAGTTYGHYWTQDFGGS
jgi:uncharacterized protein YkwD